MVFHPLQRGGKADVLQRTFRKNPIVHSSIVRVLIRPQHLESVIELHRFQTLAPRERTLGNDFKRPRELNVSEIRVEECEPINAFEAVWKLIISRFSTPVGCIVLDCFQYGKMENRLESTFLEAPLSNILESIWQANTFQVFAVFKRAVLDSL